MDYIPMLNEFLRWARFKRVLESDDASVYEMISTYWKWYCLHISQLQAVWHKRAVTCLRHSHVRTRPSRRSNPCSAVYYRNILKMQTRNLVKTKYRYTQNSLRFSVGFYYNNTSGKPSAFESGIPVRIPTGIIEEIYCLLLQWQNSDLKNWKMPKLNK